MKWENCNINVAEWANITKFSELDDKGTPLRPLEFFFDDVLVDMIVGYTTLYSYREKADISFEITNEKIHLFLSMLPLIGCHKLPNRKTYWETTHDTFVYARSDSMPRNMFEHVPRNLHLWGNEQLDK